MSTTVISQGYIAVLVNPLTDCDDREYMSEKLYDEKSTLELNYKGTLLFSDTYRTKSYSDREFCGDFFIVGNMSNVGVSEFIDKANAAGLLIDIATIKPYTCIWYNGSDCPVSMMTKEEFMEK